MEKWELIKKISEIRKEISKISGKTWIDYNNNKNDLNLTNNLVILDGAIESLDKILRNLSRLEE